MNIFNEDTNNKFSNVFVVIVFLVAGLMAYVLLAGGKWLEATIATSGLQKYTKDITNISSEECNMNKQLKFVLYISESDYKSLYSNLSESRTKFINLSSYTDELNIMNVFEFVGKSSDMQEIVELLEEVPCNKKEVIYDTINEEELFNKTMNNVVQYREQVKLGQELIDKGSTNELLDKRMKELNDKLAFEEELLSLIMTGEVTIIRIVAVQHYE